MCFELLFIQLLLVQVLTDIRWNLCFCPECKRSSGS